VILVARAKKKFISGAIKRPGALTRKAKAAGMSINEYCSQSDLSTLSKRQCALAKTLRKLSRKRSK
jgi:protein involved in polysaccharide export with SLBB domain